PASARSGERAADRGGAQSPPYPRRNAGAGPTSWCAAGASVFGVTLSKWLVFSGIATVQALVVAFVFVAIRPAPVHSLVLGHRTEFCLELVLLTIAAVSLGLLISVVARKLVS